MSVSIPLIPLGSRVRVRRGSFPVDPAVLGLTGTVVAASEYRPNRYDVSLDATGEVRPFSPSELEVLAPPAITGDQLDAGRRRALP